MTKIKQNNLNNIRNNKANNKVSYRTTKLGRSLKLCLSEKQITKINQWLGCIRKVKNIKISQIHSHNEKYLSNIYRNSFKVFKENHPSLKDNENPYKYIFPDQSYAFAKELVINFVGPLNKGQYEDIYTNNKHYLERVPSELYRNSMKDLLEGNKKYIKDYFDSKILYHNKRKELKFIKKSDNVESLFITGSDNLYQFIGNKLYIGKNIEKNLLLESEIKSLNKKLNIINHYDKYVKLLNKVEFKVELNKVNKQNVEITTKSKAKPKNKSNNKLNSKLNKENINFIKSLSNLNQNEKESLIKEIENKIVELSSKLDREISYLGELKFNKPKKNKSYKEINFKSIKGIRIKKDKNNYYITFSFDYVNQYQASLFDIENKNEILSKEHLALYLKEITDKLGKEKAIEYLSNKILGIDRGINERLSLNINKLFDKDINKSFIKTSNNDLGTELDQHNLINEEINNIEDKYLTNFLSYEPEVKAYIEKLKKQIEYHNKQLKRRIPNSRGYNKAKQRYRKLHKKVANIKQDINHKVSNHIISQYSQPIIALEKLNIKGMTKRAMPKVDIKKSLESNFNTKHGLDELKLNQIVESLEEYYKSNTNKLKYKDIVGDYKLSFMKNNGSAKSGLNESILTQNWGQFGLFIEYKGNLNGKIVIEVDPKYTSQECNVCGYINEGNRIKSKFCCLKCNHKEHADSNASNVIASRVYKELLKYAEEIMSKEAKEKIKNKAKDSNSNKNIDINKDQAPWDMGIIKADGNNKDKDIKSNQLRGELSSEVCKSLQ